MADGIKGELGVPSADYRKWLKKHRSKLNNLVSLLADEINSKGYQMVVAVSALKNKDWNNSVLEALVEHIDVEIKYIYFNHADKDLEAKFEEAHRASCSLDQLTEVISGQLRPRRQSKDGNLYTMPYRPGDPTASGKIDKGTFNSMSRFMDPLIMEDDCYTSELAKSSFYRGEAQCPWAGIRDGWPVENNQLKKLVESIKSWIEAPPYKNAWITHIPGVGGSTMARMAAWKLHKSTPVVWIHTKEHDYIKEMLENLYDHTKLPVVAFVEMPYVMTREDVRRLASSVSSKKNILIVGVGRKGSDTDDRRRFPIMDWGNDMPYLVNAYRPFLAEQGYPQAKTEEKTIELDRLATDARNNEKIPFIVGLTTFDEDYKGIENYVGNFKNTIGENRMMTDTLSILALCDKFGYPTLPSQLFRGIFNGTPGRLFTLETPFKGTGIIDSLIVKVKETDPSSWKLRSPALADQILMTFGGLSRNRANEEECLYDLSKKLIDYSGRAAYPDGDAFKRNMLFEDFLFYIFINRSDTPDEDYSPLVSKLSDQHKVEIFKKLVEKFPCNPHFCSHLARCYSKIDKDFEKAIEYASRAIDLSDSLDPVIYHMRGECYRTILKEKLDKAKSLSAFESRAEDFSIPECIESASSDYIKALNMQYESGNVSAHSYFSHIRLLFDVLEKAKKVGDIKARALLTKEPYGGWWQQLQSLVEELDREREYLYVDGADIDSNVARYKGDLNRIIGQYSEAIQLINNEIDRRETPQLRRAAVMLHLQRDDSKKDLYRTDSRLNERLRSMLEKNLDEEFTPGDFNLWLEIIRYSDLPIRDALDSINRWRGRVSESRQTVQLLEFYCFVFNVLLGIDGSSTAVVAASDALAVCQKLRPNSTKIIEYAYKPEGDAVMKDAIIRNIKENNPEIPNCYRLMGNVTRYRHDGWSEISCEPLGEKLKIFFNPRNNHLDDSILHQDVEFRLGFSYDGLRAEDVRRADTAQ